MTNPSPSKSFHFLVKNMSSGSAQSQLWAHADPLVQELNHATG